MNQELTSVVTLNQRKNIWSMLFVAFYMYFLFKGKNYELHSQLKWGGISLLQVNLCHSILQILILQCH